MKIKIRALGISFLLSVFLMLLMHWGVLPKGGKLTQSFGQFSDLWSPSLFVVVFTIIFYLIFYVAKKNNEKEITLICNECEEVMSFHKFNRESIDKQCPKCGGKLVSLKGFYEKKY